MKRSLLVMVGALTALATPSQAQPHTTGYNAWLVKAIDNVTGRPIEPIPAESKEKADQQVEYLESLKHPDFPSLPGFSYVHAARNPMVKGSSQTLPQPPSAGEADQRGRIQQTPVAPNRRTPSHRIIVPPVLVPTAPKNAPQMKPSQPVPTYNTPAIKLPPNVPPSWVVPGRQPEAGPSGYRQSPAPTSGNQPAPITTRGYGYDNDRSKELAPKGVTMRVGIDRGTLQRVEAPSTLLDALRAAK